MVGLVLVAAGRGQRFGEETPKQFIFLHGIPLYLHALRQLAPVARQVAVVVPPDWKDRVERQLDQQTLPTELMVVVGGAQRQDSVAAGLKVLSAENRIILVHDAARPNISSELIERVVKGTLRHQACVPALPISETVKEVQQGKIVRTLDRDELRLIQTPQGFEFSLLQRALDQARRSELVATDEATLVERMGAVVHVVEGEKQNLKVTFPSDFQSVGAEMKTRSTKPDRRVGLGYDFHPFEANRRLMLGGVRIEHPVGLAGHSDGDAILHAICDGLLGAAGLSDIGTYFPEEARFKDIDSSQLLASVYRKVRQQGYRLVNLDTVVLAEAPKLQPFVGAIKDHLSKLLGVERTHIGVKATTMEGCGPIGRGEGIAAQAVVLLAPQDSR